MQLYTARYQEFQPEWGIPVRSTIGAPRFHLRYDLAGWWRGVSPEREWLKGVPYVDFRRLYRHKLHKQGIDRLMQTAEGFVPEDQDPTHARLVVLCYEDIRKPQEWCHRELMAEWFEEKGVPVIELCGPAHQPRPCAPAEADETPVPPGQMLF
jgi:hypothetical protein